MGSQLSLCLSQAGDSGCHPGNPDFGCGHLDKKNGFFPQEIIPGTTVLWRQLRGGRPARPIGSVSVHLRAILRPSQLWDVESKVQPLQDIAFPQEGKPGVPLPQGQLGGGLQENEASQTHWSWQLSSGNNPGMYRILEVGPTSGHGQWKARFHRMESPVPQCLRGS